MDAYATRRIPVGRSEVVADVWDGRGPRVLLVHGIPGWRGSWREVARRLAPPFSVVAPDLLGFGSSGPAPRGAHAQAHAEALTALLDALGWGEVHVAACDFGGPTAVTLAALRPGRVRSLVLAATNLFPDTPVPLPLRLARVPALGPAAFRLAFGRAGLTARWWAACGDRRAYPLARHRETLASDAGIASTRRILLASLRDLPALYEPVERAARLMALPAAVVWGDRDPLFPVAVGARTAGALRAPLRLLRGCGHFVPEERPDELARAIRDTIARAGDAPAAITAARS